jgi:hypothetical protein
MAFPFLNSNCPLVNVFFRFSSVFGVFERSV